MDNGAHNLVPDPADPFQLMPAFALPQTKTMLFSGMPMPPSMNHAYASVELAGVQRRVKGQAMKDYERDVATWALANSSTVRQVRDILKEALRDRTKRLGIASDFWFQREHILTQAGLPKRNDVSNRIKALHDQLSQLLGIDDCWFWGLTACKRVLPPHRKYESVDVIVTLVAD